MATNAISSATGAAQQIQQPRQSLQTLQTESGNSIKEAAKPKQDQQPQAQKIEQPRPVTNTQGQRTGTVLNTTA